MSAISRLKALMFSVVDEIDSINDPFQEFDRPAILKYPETLRQKADKFEKDLIDNFIIVPRSGVVVNYCIPQDDRLPIPLGDQAIWHGMATAMQALKWHVTQSNEDRNRLFLFMDGQNNHFTSYTRLPNLAGGNLDRRWRLIRGRSQYDEIADDASNDTATGILVGQTFAYLFGPKDIPAPVLAPLQKLADELLENNYALIGPDYLKPTTYGALIQGWKTDPLRLSLCIAVMAAAKTIYGDTKYHTAYADLMDEYRAILRYAKVRLWWIDNKNDTHRAAAHLAIISRLTGSNHARVGLERLWKMEHKSGNSWVYFLCKWGGAFGLSIAHRDQAIKTLSEFTLEDKQYDILRDYSEAVGVDRVLWNGKWMSRQPLPVWMQSADDFVWQRNRFKLSGGSNPPSSRYSGIDYLLAYWFGRALGCIGEND